MKSKRKKTIPRLASDQTVALAVANARLKAEVKRLNKAGDAIVKDNINWCTDYNHIAAWNDAKNPTPTKNETRV